MIRYPLDFVSMLLEVLEKVNLSGPDIYILWKDECKKDYEAFTKKVLALENVQN